MGGEERGRKRWMGLWEGRRDKVKSKGEEYGMERTRIRIRKKKEDMGRSERERRRP